MTKLVRSADVSFVLYSVLPLDWIWSLARLHGKLTYHLARRRRSIVQDNLEGVFGSAKSPREIEDLTRAFLEYQRLRGVLLALSPRLGSSELEELVRPEGLEHLDTALEQGRGAILLGSHLNSLVMFDGIIVLRARGYDVVVALPEPGDPWAPSALGRLLNRRLGTKAMFELTGAFHAQFNIRPIVQRLAGNAVVAQTGDGLHSARFVDVEFLGRRVPFPTGMMRVAQVTGAPVVPVFQVGAPPDRLRVVLEEPLTVERGEDPEGALSAALSDYATRLERHVLENPACWEHWSIANTLETMAAWSERTLEERYRV